MGKYYESEFFKWQETYGKYMEEKGMINAMRKGVKKGKEDMITDLLDTMTPDEISEKTKIPTYLIKELARKNDIEELEIREFYKWQETYGKIKEEKGIRKGKKEIIKELLKTMPPEEIAEKTNIELIEINEIAKSG